jgi:hypothetical protein
MQRHDRIVVARRLVDNEAIRSLLAIENSGAKIFFLGLGCRRGAGAACRAVALVAIVVTHCKREKLQFSIKFIVHCNTRNGLISSCSRCSSHTLLLLCLLNEKKSVFFFTLRDFPPRRFPLRKFKFNQSETSLSSSNACFVAAIGARFVATDSCRATLPFLWSRRPECSPLTLSYVGASDPLPR